MTLSTRFLLAAAVLLAAGCRTTVAAPEGAPVYAKGENGFDTFRIPALCVTAKGTLLALCEKDGLPHYPYNDFFTVTRQLGHWLRSEMSQAATSAAVA